MNNKQEMLRDLKRSFNERMTKLITTVTVNNYSEYMYDIGGNEYVDDMEAAMKDMADTIRIYRDAKTAIATSVGDCDTVSGAVSMAIRYNLEKLSKTPEDICLDAALSDDFSISFWNALDYKDGKPKEYMRVLLTLSPEGEGKYITNGFLFEENFGIYSEEDVEPVAREISGIINGMESSHFTVGNTYRSESGIEYRLCDIDWNYIDGRYDCVLKNLLIGGYENAVSSKEDTIETDGGDRIKLEK